MLNRKLRLNFDRCLVLMNRIGFIFLISLSAVAQEESSLNDTVMDYDNPSGLVELHIKGDPNATYKMRRTDWSWRFNASVEKFYPNSYVSPADAATFSNIFGSNQGSVVTLGLGGQYNTSIGSFFVDAIYGSGALSGTIGGVTTGLSVSKYGGQLGLFLDTLFENPYFSPYVAVQVINFNWKEISTNINIGGTTAITTGTVAGISIHLNRVDSAAASVAYISDGIKNTFLDIFGVQYNTSNSSHDPNLQTAWNLGAGFHLEF